MDVYREERSPAINLSVRKSLTTETHGTQSEQPKGNHGLLFVSSFFFLFVTSMFSRRSSCHSTEASRMGTRLTDVPMRYGSFGGHSPNPDRDSDFLIH